MSKFRLLLLGLLLLADDCEAGPKQIFQRVTSRVGWKFVGLEALNVGTSIVTSFTIRQCANDHGLGRCVGGDYGPMAAKESIRNGLTVGLIIPTKFLKDTEDAEHRKFKGWWLVPVANIAVNGGVILRNRLRNFPPRELDEH